jgi:hypothetical protein
MLILSMVVDGALGFWSQEYAKFGRKEPAKRAHHVAAL